MQICDLEVPVGIELVAVAPEPRVLDGAEGRHAVERRPARRAAPISVFPLGRSERRYPPFQAALQKVAGADCKLAELVLGCIEAECCN